MLKRLRELFSGPPAASAPAQSAPAAHPPPPVKEPSPLENPQAYLERVQTKINDMAEEFANGAINRLQFQELYEHYRREQQTIKRYLEMSPDSEEWKSATSEGKSVVIRQQNVAKVLGHSVYDNESGMPLNTIGEFEIEADLAVPMLSSYRSATKEIFGAEMSKTAIEGGRWLSYVPGEFTTLMTLFSTDPAPQQLESLEELHGLFERANRTLLSNQPVDPDELVFIQQFFLGRQT